MCARPFPLLALCLFPVYSFFYYCVGTGKAKLINIKLKTQQQGGGEGERGVAHGNNSK